MIIRLMRKKINTKLEPVGDTSPQGFYDGVIYVSVALMYEY